MNNQDFQGIVITLLVVLVIITGEPMLSPVAKDIGTLLLVGLVGFLGLFAVLALISIVLVWIDEKIRSVKVPPWIPKILFSKLW